jgi:cytoskeletal protein CcmA (bactofilin family)
MPLKRPATRHRRFTDVRAPVAILIGPDVTVRGEITGNASVDFAGTLDGDLVTDGLVIIRPGGRVTGRIQATAVVVQGRVDGDIHASGRVELGQSCSVEGDIFAATVAIADGARYDGAIAMAGSATSREQVAFVEKRSERG